MPKNIFFLIALCFFASQQCYSQNDSSLIRFFNWQQPDDIVVFNDSNCSIELKQNQFKKYYNKDSSVIYDDDTKMFSIQLTHYKWENTPTVRLSFKNNVPVVFYDKDTLMLDTLKEDVSLNMHYQQFYVKVHGAILFSFENKKLKFIHLQTLGNKVRRRCRITLQKIKNNEYQWGFIEDGFSNKSTYEFAFQNNFYGVPNLLHYYNYAPKQGFYSIGANYKKNEFVKMYEFNQQLLDNPNRYDDSRLIINLKTKKLKGANIFEILNWQKLMHDFYVDAGIEYEMDVPRRYSAPRR